MIRYFVRSTRSLIPFSVSFSISFSSPRLRDIDILPAVIAFLRHRFELTYLVTFLYGVFHFIDGLTRALEQYVYENVYQRRLKISRHGL